MGFEIKKNANQINQSRNEKMKDYEAIIIPKAKYTVAFEPTQFLLKHGRMAKTHYVAEISNNGIVAKIEVKHEISPDEDVIFLDSVLRYINPQLNRMPVITEMYKNECVFENFDLEIR